MVRVNWTRYGLYLLRWQLSTPILALVLIALAAYNKWVATIIANLIGGLIFFWADRYIFTSTKLSAQWEVKENIACSDCNKTARGYRLVKTKNYDKSGDKAPKFRCENCSQKKSESLRKEGINVD